MTQWTEETRQLFNHLRGCPGCYRKFHMHMKVLEQWSVLDFFMSTHYTVCGRFLYWFNDSPPPPFDNIVFYWNGGYWNLFIRQRRPALRLCEIIDWSFEVQKKKNNHGRMSWICKERDVLWINWFFIWSTRENNRIRINLQVERGMVYI